MKITYTDFGPQVPVKAHYERGVDFLSHEFDLEYEDASYLISKLKHNRSRVFIVTQLVTLDFYIDGDHLHAQVEDWEGGIWCASTLDLETAGAILKGAFEGCDYSGSTIPGSNRRWDLY